jgi:mono/diheme cytochrome c family protein
MSRLKLNLVLLSMIAVCLGLVWFLPRNNAQPNYELLPEAQMARSPAFSTFAPNANFPDGMTLRTPPLGTIPRGELPLHYGASPTEGVRAGNELQNPLSAASSQVRQRGAFLFATYCQVCHGVSGLGDGPVTRRGVPAPLSMLTGKAVQMKDGELFHLLTFGQGNMSSHATQLSPFDRWCVIHYTRQLQNKLAVPSTVKLADTVKVFQTNCAACHSMDGTGSLLRAKYPKIPDFTSRAWQVSQTDLEITSRIEYGDMPQMPTFRYILTRDQILALAAYIRTFAGTGTAVTGAPAPSGPLPAGMAPEKIFRSQCLACHNVDGRGAIVRAAMPDIPDFTSPPWHASKKDAELTEAILKGGKFMPPMKDRLSRAEAEKMVHFVRGFQGGKQVVALESLEVPKEVVPIPPGVGPKIPPGEPVQPPKIPPPPPPEGRRVRAGAVLFREYCIVCHGPDGTGSSVRAQLPPIPDFTKGAWQSEHSDPQLLISILDGKGTLMPANRGRVTEGQARDLVAYIRAFGPPEAQAGQLAPSEFQKRFDTLQQQWETLEKQMRELPTSPPKP